MDPRLKAYQKQTRSPAQTPRGDPQPTVRSASLPRFEEPAAVPPPKDGLVKTSKTAAKPAAKNPLKERSLRKVAKFLILLGQDEASKVVRHLDPAQIESLGQEIAAIKTIEPVEAEAILKEFGYLTTANLQAVRGGAVVAQAILHRAFGEQRGQAILAKAAPAPIERPFSYLNDLERPLLAALLGKESTSVLSLVVPFLDKAQSAALLKYLDPGIRIALVKRLAKMESVPSAVVAQVDQALKERVHTLKPTSTAESVDGKAKLAQILRHMSAEHETLLLNRLAQEGPALTEDLRNRLFTADDLTRIGDDSMEELLRTKTDAQLGLLYLAASETLKTKIEANLSRRRFVLVQAEADLQGAPAQRELQTAMKDFLDEVRQALQEGRVQLLVDGEEYL